MYVRAMTRQFADDVTQPMAGGSIEAADPPKRSPPRWPISGCSISVHANQWEPGIGTLSYALAMEELSRG